jgi:3-hydroxyisobutyrate dehydrogenase
MGGELSVTADRTAVGVIGLGRMGLSIAARLHDAGVHAIATDRRPELEAVAHASGIHWAEGVAEAASTSQIAITVLPGPAEVRAVIEPVLANLHPGATWIDMTSGVPALSAEIRSRADGRVRILECPVGGDPAAARRGQLIGYLGAEHDDRAAHRWLLELLCRELVHVGAPGTGYAVKLLVNLLWFGQAIAVSEVLTLASRIGVDPDQLRATLSRGPAASRFLKDGAAALLRGDDMTTFALSRCVEELVGVLDLAGGNGVTLPVAERVADVYAEALRHYGDVDGELLAARLVAERSGVRFAGAGD